MVNLNNARELQVVSCPGISVDSLGEYLMGIGLLSVLSQCWPGVRGCWRNDNFCIIAEGASKDAIENRILDRWKVAESEFKYESWWKEDQKKDTKAKSDINIWRARSQQDDIRKVIHLDAHIIGAGRNQFNPIFGTGGNIGRRDIAKAANKAISELKNESEQIRELWLKYTLWCEGDPELPELSSTGTWFIFANKTFNSGQEWYQEGRLSPWSFLLALKGALLLVGGVNRRWSGTAHPYAVFPFITDIASPSTQEEVGLAKAEFWAPLWSHPATLTEVRALFERGYSRIGERTAKAPHEFALAARAAGVDAGISAFARFVLRQTTSAQTYEAIPEEHIRTSDSETAEATLIQELMPWLDRLPDEPRDSKRRGEFRGLRGPIERLIIKVFQRPDDPEHWQKLLLSLSETQLRLDNNREWRTRCDALPWLHPDWFEKAWPEPPTEIQVARAIASLGAGTKMPLLVNIFSVELGEGGQPFFPKERPQKAVWHCGAVVPLLADVLQRRLIDTDSTGELPLKAPYLCDAQTIRALLAGALDWDLIGRWIPPLSLVRWSWQANRPQPEESSLEADGLCLLIALFRPFFHPYSIKLDDAELFPERLRPTAITARSLLNLIRQGEWHEAIRLAESRYRAAGISIVTSPMQIIDDEVDGELAAASLLIPLNSRDVAAGIRRWIQHQKI